VAKSRAAKQFGELYGEISKDIFKFCRALNYKPTGQQKELLTAVQKAVYGGGPRRIAVKSGQGPGKSKASGVVGLWLLLLQPYTKLIVTAPTFRQCKEVWLAEAKLTMRGADPSLHRLFSFSNTGIGICGQRASDWGALLITATKSEASQGQHRKDMHVIVEEASGVAREQIEQYKGTLSNPNAIFLMIGNPNTRDCDFFDCFNLNRHLWDCYTWNAEETPRSEWFDPKRNSDLAEEFGRDSDVYRIRVLGQFPFADPNCVMSSEHVELCMDRKLVLPCSKIIMAGRQSPVKQFGMDFARFGGDENTIYRRSGQAIVEWERHSRTDPNDVVDRAFAMQTSAYWRNSECRYVADAGGMGQGVMGNFHRAKKNIYEFHFGGSAVRVDFANQITEAYFHLAKQVKEQRASLPKDNVLVHQLSSRQYFTDAKGKLVLEKKDDYIKRGHDSPDRADGCVLAYYDRHVAQGRTEAKTGSGRRAGDMR
jgi:hypothetical protein